MYKIIHIVIYIYIYVDTHIYIYIYPCNRISIDSSIQRPGTPAAAGLGPARSCRRSPSAAPWTYNVKNIHSSSSISLYMINNKFILFNLNYDIIHITRPIYIYIYRERERESYYGSLDL